MSIEKNVQIVKIFLAGLGRTGAMTLSLKLMPHEGMLVSRILATDSKTVMLPTFSA